MLTLRTRIFAVISLIVLFVLGVSLILVVVSKKKKAATLPATTAAGNVIDQNNFDASTLTPAPAAQPITAGLKVKPATTEEMIKNAARQAAKIFVERYGSYSTDNNYQNIREAQGLVTTDLWAKISGRLSIPAPVAVAFAGVTTKVLTSEFTEWSGAGADLLLKVQREENKAGVISSTYQDISVRLIKQDDNWLVNSFEWKK